MQSIDLHTHTTASDGTLTPTELLAKAAEVGLTAIAVTDHDTLDGLDEASAAATRYGIELVQGIELSIDYPNGRLHLLGYLFDPTDRTLNDRLVLLKENRVRRNERMVAKMQKLGLPVSLDEVRQESGGGQIGRPHMALALVKKGIVSSVPEAFDRFLGSGAPAHVPKDKINIEEGLDLIHGAGGVASVAHPNSLMLEEGELGAELKRLRLLGLDAVECYYNRHTPDRTRQLLSMARAAGLLVSGGSDFHGDAKPDVHLGWVDGDRPAPDALLVALKAARVRSSHAI